VGIVSKEATKKDLTHMLKAGREHNIPVIIGSAGGSGAHVHVQCTLKIVEEIAKEQNLPFKLALIHAEADKDFLQKKLADGKITSLGPVPELTS